MSPSSRQFETSRHLDSDMTGLLIHPLTALVKQVSPGAGDLVA